MPDLFHLENSSFSSSLTSSLSSLLATSSLCDCSLICSDGQLSAHKVILAATSSFFSSVFSLHHHNHPLIYLRGIKTDQMQAVLGYIYSGGTQVAEEDLASFLAVAEDLKIDGLTRKEEEIQTSNDFAMSSKEIKNEVLDGNQKKKTKDNINQEQENRPEQICGLIGECDAGKILKYDTDGESWINACGSEDSQDKEFERDAHNDLPYVIENMPDDVSSGTNAAFLVMNNSVSMNEIEEKIEEMIFVDNGCWGCKKCGKVMRKKQHIKNHAESHLEGYSHPCPICRKSSKTRNALSNHISYFHKHPMAKMPMPMT
eukprot:GFUD01025136.1.p1 GENE.GFUD01025136.1~~GFUD01025136.1.p1  ORF type:complete len:315 (+),score=98.65 GFUD01025136.1:98-1042(+)